MADASALPTDDDQQLGPTSASLEASGAGSEPPGETPRESPGESAAPAESQVESQVEEVEAAAGEAPAIEAAEAPQADLAPEAEAAAPAASEPEPSEPDQPSAPDQPETETRAVKPAPGPSFAVAIPSFSSPEPALSFASVAKPAEPSPEPAAVPAPVEPAPLPPEAEPALAAWADASAKEPEPVAPEPAPEPEVAPVTPPPVPTVATTIDLPARGDGAATGAPGEGGEWALLLSKLQAWLGSGQLQAQLQAARTPLTLVAGLIALVVVVQIYAALLGVIEHFPLAPGLLELVGLITVVRFGLTKLVRSQERRALIEGLQQRWQAFRGQA